MSDNAQADALLFAVDLLSDDQISESIAALTRGEELFAAARKDFRFQWDLNIIRAQELVLDALHEVQQDRIDLAAWEQTQDG